MYSIFRPVVAVGNFDGVHRGHQSLLSEALMAAHSRATFVSVLTFSPHPRTFFFPEEPVFQLTSPLLKEEFLKNLGVSEVFSLCFDSALASLMPDAFVKNILYEKLKACLVVVGQDFRFGFQRQGTVERLQRLGQKYDFQVLVSVPFYLQTEIVSSSAIRTCLREGGVRQAQVLLGYPWTLEGKIIAGEGRGRTLGFATANLELSPDNALREGIYAAYASLSDPSLLYGKRHIYPSAVYVGKKPTFKGDTKVLEAHLFDFSEDIYGKDLRLHFIDFIRPDRSFASPLDLSKQMEKDCFACREILETPAYLASVLDNSLFWRGGG